MSRTIEFDDDFESFMRDMDYNLEKAEETIDKIFEQLTRSNTDVREDRMDRD